MLMCVLHTICILFIPCSHHLHCVQRVRSSTRHTCTKAGARCAQCSAWSFTLHTFPTFHQHHAHSST
eukprot:1160941-Pelagomonas_calceolata.AAC.11